MKAYWKTFGLMGLVVATLVGLTPSIDAAKPTEQTPANTWIECQNPPCEPPPFAPPLECRNPGESILEDLFGNTEEQDRECQKPCVLESHEVIRNANNQYDYEFQGVITIPIQPNTWNGLNHSKRTSIREVENADGSLTPNPLIPDSERDAARARFEAIALDPNYRIIFQQDRCKDGCICISSKNAQGQLVPVPGAQPAEGTHVVLINGGFMEVDGQRFQKFYLIKTRTRRMIVQGTCRGASNFKLF